MNNLFGNVIEVEIENIRSFSSNLKKIEDITLRSIKDKNLLIELAENFFEMLNRGDLLRNEDRDQNELTIKLVTFLKILEDVKNRSVKDE